MFPTDHIVSYRPHAPSGTLIMLRRAEPQDYAYDSSTVQLVVITKICPELWSPSLRWKPFVKIPSRISPYVAEHHGLPSSNLRPHVISRENHGYIRMISILAGCGLYLSKGRYEKSKTIR